MCNRRLAGCLLCLVPLLVPMLGCQSLHGDPSVVVLVRDAETKKPLSSAEVYLCQRNKDDTVEPCRCKEFTQADGIARLRAESGGQYGVEVQAVAAGYLPEKVKVSADDFKKIKSIPASPTNEQRPADAIVEAYAEPGFSVELVIPPGYRGLIEAEIDLQDNVPIQLGQRCFPFSVPASAIVQIKGPALLMRVAPADYRGRYVGGPLLTMAMDAEKVGFRWLKGAGKKHYFVIGTQIDYEKFQHQLTPEQQANSDSWEDPSLKAKRGKYRYEYITSQNENASHH